ncbi:hypothetical protein [Gimesia sp.]|uniref:hypothetical protein n=1 Tax=Gimesia sp. TaxID=2024833 RepID=UPI003A914994
MCPGQTGLKFAFRFSLWILLSGSIAYVAGSESLLKETDKDSFRNHSILEFKNQDIDWELTPSGLLKPVVSKNLSNEIQKLSVKKHLPLVERLLKDPERFIVAHVIFVELFQLEEQAGTYIDGDKCFVSYHSLNVWVHFQNLNNSVQKVVSYPHISDQKIQINSKWSLYLKQRLAAQELKPTEEENWKEALRKEFPVSLEESQVDNPVFHKLIQETEIEWRLAGLGFPFVTGHSLILDELKTTGKKGLLQLLTSLEDEKTFVASHVALSTILKPRCDFRVIDADVTQITYSYAGLTVLYQWKTVDGKREFGTTYPNIALERDRIRNYWKQILLKKRQWSSQ